MNLLFCNYEYPPLGGGGGVVMAALARELACRHSVTVLTSAALQLPTESREQGLRVVRVPVPFRRELAVATVPSLLAYVLKGTWRGRALGRSNRFDLVNTHFVVPTGPVGQAVADHLGIPNVLSVHGGDLYDPSKSSSPHRHWWLRGPVRYLLSRAHIIVGQSRDTLRRLRELYGVQRSVELIPLGIARPGRLRPASRSDLGVPPQALVLVTVGRVVARKNVAQLLEILQRCGRPAAHLIVIGSGPLLQELRAEAGARGLGQRVHLLGQVDEQKKYAVLAASDVFVSSSQHEGFGLVFLEAMACGLPVVCYDQGGQVDFLRSGENGFVVPLNDQEAFARAIITMNDDPGLRRDIAQRNRLQIEDYFIERCAERYEEVFEAVLRARGGGAMKPLGVAGSG